MLAVQFGGKGKWRVEWGVKRGESAAPFLGEVGSSGRPVGLPEEEDSRAADRVGPPVIEGEGERWAATGPEGGEREVGSGWGRNRKWSDSRNKILSNFIWNLDFWETLKNCTMRFRRNFDMGILPKIF
jgi:hypothetical protein